MKTEHAALTRRAFLDRSAKLMLGLPFAGNAILHAAASANRSDARVALTFCRDYGPEVKVGLQRCFDLLGGIGSLVQGKTVTVKINLTGTDFRPLLDRPVGETYMTHFSTAAALTAALFDAGARRVRFVESTTSRGSLESSLGFAGWDVKALAALGNVEFENTRNLGKGKAYAHLKVPTAGYLFSSFDLNHAYDETDVLVSLCKLKQHVTAGVTLSMKNLFGITPNSLYGDEAGSEDATGGRSPLHFPSQYRRVRPPGLKPGDTSTDATFRIPRIVADVCAARPIHLAIIDAITSMSGGEGPWCRETNKLKLTKPGLLIAGLNPVSTDAIGTAVMGYDNPRATRGTHPFSFCDNHLLLAEQTGLGTAELAKIEVLGVPLDKAVCRYDRIAGS
jgi:uncharacterized protein (DUF362 family)